MNEENEINYQSLSKRNVFVVEWLTYSTHATSFTFGLIPLENHSPNYHMSYGINSDTTILLQR